MLQQKKTMNITFGIAVLCFATLVNCACAKTHLGVEDTTHEKTMPALTDIKKITPVTDLQEQKPTNTTMLPNATLNLQTTVTGNQEQPRVLYILPWQSPVTDAVDFESFDNQQKAVFEHVEREELRRELESVIE